MDKHINYVIMTFHADKPTLEDLQYYGVMKNVQGKWEELAIALGQKDNIPNFQSQTLNDTNKCCIKVFDAWINNDGYPPRYPLSWQGFYDVMKFIGHLKVANDMLDGMGISEIVSKS